MKNFQQYRPQHSGLEEELIIKDIFISSAVFKGWVEANLSSSDDEDELVLPEIVNQFINIIELAVYQKKIQNISFSIEIFSIFSFLILSKTHAALSGSTIII